VVRALLLAVLLHPLHTSLAVLSLDRSSITVSLRMFSNDLAEVSDKPFDYAASTFILRDAGGKPIKLTSCGSKVVGDLTWLCMRGMGTAVTVESKVLFDKYSDQINVVQAPVNGHSRNILFISRDHAKRLD